MVFVPPVMAQSFSGYSSIIIGASADRSDLRESMRREHRERVERGFSGNPDKPVSGNGGRPDQVNVGDPRENENAARRERWQRMSPEEREQMRRDIHQAGRTVYPRNPAGESH
ncbi:MAG: hypothetical protein KBA96_11725 [Rhodocyclaceae bacterium]|nr:hypothetical protein [Rhodocyclaceae bacterium]MBP7081774.1 hypothetical protein [Rhodocyclaceae bacterium]